MSVSNNYHIKLRELLDSFVHDVYKITKEFPRDELYGVVSQLRRAALSVVLNYIEGSARRSQKKVCKNFLWIAYGSFQEAKYLIEFSIRESFVSEARGGGILKKADEIGAMLWGILKNS